MDTPQHLDPQLSQDERARRRAELRTQFSDLPFELNAAQLDNYIDALHRLAEPAPRLDEIADPILGRVTAADIDDVLEFFDREAFADKPEWADCYCRFHHVDQEAEWPERTWRQNRAELAEALRSGETRAVIARVGGRVAAWLNCSNRATSPQHATAADEGIACTFCWLTAPAYRGHGLARKLLDKALMELAHDGMSTVEGYAIEHPSDEAAAYVGPLSMYESAGFDIADRTEDRLTVRRRL